MGRRLAAIAVFGLLLTGCNASDSQDARTSTAPSAVCGKLPVSPTGHAEATGKRVTISPRAARADVGTAYRILDRQGLRVDLASRTYLSSLDPEFASLDPPAGTSVARGSVVTITPCPGGLGSPAVSKADPHFVVPDFKAQPLSAAIDWANQHGMFWAVSLPASPIPEASSLFDAYRVVGQDPKPGASISQGVQSGNSFRVTPLTLTVDPI
jgi:beta-lactam-binding protein with PASTA domain